jgi:D-aminopeptidase
MTQQTSPATVDQVISALPLRYKGPGGAVALVRNGDVVARHVWGFANLQRRIP